VGRVISLDRALDRLLHHRSYLRAFLEGRTELLDVSAEDLAALGSIDRIQLQKTAERVRHDLLQRKHRGSGGIVAMYPRTIDAWKSSHPEDAELEELLSGFMESAPFEDYRELPFAGLGLSLEEAFFRFCEAEDIGDGGTREREFLTAMMKALVVSPCPDFTLPATIRRAQAGFFAVSVRAEPVLYAAARGRLTIGPITPFLSDLLTSSDPPAELARRHDVSPPVLQASLVQLAAMGLAVSTPVDALVR
jgi:hypothetical protein